MKIRAFTLLTALLFSVASVSCVKKHEHVKPKLAFQTGPAVFMQLGGVISTFTVLFEGLGSEPIEEYGIVYTFSEDVKDNYPDLDDTKVVFDLPAQLNSNQKVVNIGFPAGVHALGYRAYVKIKGGHVTFAPPIITYF
ncbi:hypothetical protein GCM10010967_45540 [Dyadobacter beijingensis]|uniref:Uncharacterized protein n=1 Tax=Dyadobacter beijingensis TaxID=365489 RepID=A0ABQ2IDD2_9BACT|nr:hypothetical protein [Dyadobacter beijingensis]GGN05287.1 hypothetical protein GCM10010967_45540 [Dyadobacter beijingensis]